MAGRKKKDKATEKKKQDIEAGVDAAGGGDFKKFVTDWATDPQNGLSTAQVEESLEIYGKNDIPVHSTPVIYLFLRQFVGFLPFLIELAAVISISLQDYPDFAIVVAMLLINGLLGFREEYHAKLALDELSNSIESEMTVLRDGKATVITTSELVPGDMALLVGGTIIPADIKWIRGDPMSLDTAAMTGEPIPRKYPSSEYGDVMMSGTTVQAGECYGQVVATGVDTEMGQAQADIMKDKSVRIVSVFQRKIDIIVKVIVIVALCFSMSVLLVQGIGRNGFGSGHVALSTTILDALSIMIAAIPIALPLVIQVNMALGASYLAKHHHAIVTSVPSLQDIASMSILCSDKTGTLTTANMSIIKEKSHAEDDFTVNEVLLYGYLCANADKKDDPIDRAIVKAFGDSSEVKSVLSEKGYKQMELVGFNPDVKRALAFVSCGENKVMTIAKGLPAKILNTSAGGQDSGEIQWVCEGAEKKSFIKRIEDIDKGLSSNGYKTIAIAVCDEDARNIENPSFRFVGLLPMLDPPRVDTARTIASLHHANVNVKMITGDHVNVGRETARLIGLGTNIMPGEDIRKAASEETKTELIWESDGFAAVLPSDKREVVLTLKNHYGVVTGMTGDGVNDAPALSAAQVGIAVNGATDAAKNAADLILTEDGLSPIYGAVFESRRIFARIKAYVVYRIAASIEMVLVLSILIFGYGCAVRSLLVIILALLNDISMIPVAYDNAACTAKPQLPRALPLCCMSAFFGICHTGLALFLICYLAENDPVIGVDFSLTTTCTSKTYGFIWLHLLISTELMIFSARAPHFFFRSVPSIYLVMSVLLTCAVGSIIAVFALDVHGQDLGWIWLFNVLAFIVIDAAKIMFQNFIGQNPGEIITSEKILDEVPEVSEAEKFMEKKVRMRRASQATLSLHDMRHSVEIIDVGTGFGRRVKQISNASFVSNGFVRPGSSFNDVKTM